MRNLFKIFLPKKFESDSNNADNRILIISEDPILQNVHNHYFNVLLGFDVDMATTSKQALILFIQNEYKLILLDAELSAINGFHVCKQIRCLEQLVSKNRSIIIMLTSCWFDESKIITNDMKINELVMKPITFEKIESVVNRWL